jgi:16S rRNA (guanine1516-N2)-methyltransferase
VNPSTEAALKLLKAHSEAAAARFSFAATDDGIDIGFAEHNIRFKHSFLSGPFARRAGQSNQALLKACNNKQRNIHTLLDMTGGWGIDSLSLAAHGQQVTLLEQNELVFAIVAYSLGCLAATQDGSSLTSRITLKRINAYEYLQSADSDAGFDCIYLDPMFPDHKSTAKPAKALQVLQALTENRDIDSCFEFALETARKRVVVKRPARAVKLSNLKPDLVYREKTIRFDVYLTS